MKNLINRLSFVVILFITVSCSAPTNNENYQEIASPVITANGLLMVKYPQGIPEIVSSQEYKELLKEDYTLLYDILTPYDVKIQKSGNHFKVAVYHSSQQVLFDLSCTENRIDCWVYNGDCNPDTLKVDCGK